MPHKTRRSSMRARLTALAQRNSNTCRFLRTFSSGVCDWSLLLSHAKMLIKLASPTAVASILTVMPVTLLPPSVSGNGRRGLVVAIADERIGLLETVLLLEAARG